MKWNEIFRTRKLLKRLISMSLCIGMAGGQLLSGIPIQAEEQTDHTAYNLPDDPVINPSITIQHYYNFPAMVLGNVEDEYNKLKGEGAYRMVENERDLQFYLAGADDKEDSSSHYANNGKPMVVWNTDVRNGKLPENGSVVTNQNETNYKNNREKDPKSYVTLNNQGSGDIKIEKKLYKLFADETVKYLTKPQMRYMNKLYNNAEHSYNANYTLQEVWIGKDKNKTNSIKKEDFLVLHAPQLKTEDGISRHDPSKFVFTNNKDNANITETDNATGVQYGIDGNPANPNQVTVLVEEGIVIRLMFEATEGTTTLEDNVNFFDYDISDGGIYNTADDAQKTQNKRPTSEQKNFTSTVFINTEQKGINNSDNFSNEENKRSLPRLAFGNGDANLGTTLGSQTLNGNQINQVNGGNRFGALYPSWSPNTASRYYGSNLQGASFGLVTKVNSDGTLCWNNGLNAPALFSLDKEDVKYGKTIYEGLTAEEEEKSKKENGTVPENYSLQFNRVGGTYTLSGVTRDDTSTQVLSNLDKLPPCKSDVNKSIHTNEFWPLDQSGSYGTDGHDPIFGNTNQDIRYSNPSTNGVLPTSDDGKAHNAFFGMMTKIPFKLEENYCAPLRYFFYGDDDMFVFLNKLDASGNVTESKQIADLGGVHSSMGTYVNLWDFINEGNKAEIEDDTAQGDTIYKYVADKKTQADKAKANDEVQTTPAVASDSYELAVYYLERGASGSTCYMRFSVPFEGLAMDEAAMNGQVQVDKEVKHSLLNPDTEDEYVFQLELEAPDGTELNNQYAIEFFTLDEDDQGNTKETKIEDDKLPKYIAPNGTFKLKDNQRARISGLPRSGPKEDLVGSKHEGYYYKVSELGRYNSTPGYVNPKYKDSGDDNLIHLEELSPTTSTTFRKGSVDKGLDQNYQEGTSFDNLIKEENYVQFINAEDPGTITLRKELTETGGSQTEEFTFNVTLTKDGSPITKVSSLLNITEGEKIKQEREEFESTDGKYSVTVAPNQERILYNIPLGTQYEISEVEKKDEQGGKYEVDSIKISGNHTHNDPVTDLNLVRGTLDSVNGTKPAIEATFVNEYHKIAEVNIPVQKFVTGEAFASDESYTFEITPVTEGAPMPEKTQINVAPGNGMATIAAENVYDANGQFGPIVFDDTMEPGEYTYTVHEIAGEDTNIQYDSHVYNVVVTATKDVSGNVSAHITSIDNSSVINESSVNLKFTNDKVSPIDLSIPVKKNLVGRNVEKNDSFTFRISEDETHDNPKRLSNLISDRSLTIEPGTNNELKGEFIFSKFTLEDVGKEYWFVLEEQKGNIEQLDYDTSKITVKVTFELIKNTDDGSKTIVPVIQRVEEENLTIDANNPIVFTNTYQPTGTLEIPVKKTLKGRSFTNGDRFLFEITGNEGAPLPAQTILSVLPTAGDSINSSFGPITYTEDNVGDYKYTVKEISTGLSGMQYDTKQYTVNVNVKKENGTIQVTRNFTLNEQPADAIVFENVYEPEAQYAIRVTKTMTGRTMTAADQFVFTLEAVTEDAPMPEHNQVTVQGNGKNEVSTNFDPIVYTKDHAGKTYQYKVKEHRGSIEHIKYSTEEYLVSVSVTNTNGKLEVSPSIQKQTTEETSDVGSIQFTNVYQPSGTWRPTVYKQLLGARLEDGAYTFEMHVEKQDEPSVSFKRKATNSADGSINFELIEFEKTGRYNVTISEVKGNDGTIQYASEPIEYTVEVKDENGILQVEELNRQQDHVFTNDAGLRISKQLIPGTNQTLEAADLNNKFQFELDLGSVLANQTLDARRITQDQRKVEEKIDLDQTGKATFALKHNETLIVYGIGQNTPYRVQEITQDHWTGNYLFIDTIGSASGTMSDGIDAEVTFRNLKPSEDKANIHGFKTMAPDGDPFEMKGGEFEFRISAFDSTPTVRQDNEPIEPQQEILDESFEIHRSELPDESLETPVEDSETEEAENNGSAPADVQKKMKLPLLIKEAETVPAQETPLPEKTTVTNNAYGRFDFGDIVYRQPGRYVYKVEEVNNQIPGMDYDEAFYKVVVTVSQISGSLRVDSIEYMDRNDKPVTNGTILFANQYTNEQDKPALSIHKEQSVNFEDYSDSPESVSVNADDLVTYRLTIRNDGTATAKNVVVTDEVPAGLILIEQSLSDAQVDAQGTITWSIGDLGANTSRTLTFQVRVPKVENTRVWENVASVGSDNTDPHKSNEVTIESEPAKPDVTIRKYESTTQSERYDKTKPLEVKSGELVTYDMIVTNSGNEDATNVVVTDKVPDGLEFVQAFDGSSYNETNRTITWNVGTLASNGGTAIVSFQIRVPVVEKDEEWSNIASLKYDGEKPKNSNEVKINTIVKNLEIEKLQAINHGPLTKDRQAVKAGDVVTYALHITNPGDHTIENATAKDTVPDGLELITDSISDGGTYNSQTHEIIWNFGKVDAKDEKQVTFSVKVPKVDQKTSWKNIATLIYDNEKPKDSNEVVVGTDLPNLTIVKDQKLDADPDYTFEKRTGQTGDTLTYRLTVTNTGTATAKDVVIEDTIPTAELMETPLFLRFESASDDGNYNPRTQTITWSIGDVAPGQSRSVTFTVTIPGVKQNTLWINKAYTHYENNPNNPDEGDPKDIPSNEVKVDTMVPAVILEKEHKLNDGDRVTSLLHGNAQDTVTYYLKATNTSMATAHDVWIKDTIPTHENGTLVLKEIDETYAHELNEKTGEIVWKIGDLAPGEEKEVWISVTVPEVQEATRWRNIASVSHQEDPTVPREEIETPPVEVEVLVPELEIIKRQAKNNGSLTQSLIQANAGDTITYVIEVTNTGTGPAQNIVVEDIVPEGLELVNSSISDQGQNRGGKITWNMASLEAGKAKTFTFKVKVPSVKEYTRWANVATVSDEDDPDPKPTPPVEVETEAPHLTVEKSQKRNEGNRTKDKLSVVGKDRVTYFIKVTNDGQADAKDVVVSDVVPEGLILVDGSVSDSGLVEKGVISWQLGTLAAGASRTVSFAVDVPESEGVWKNIAEAIESTHPKEPTPSNEVEIETPKEEPNITIEKLQAQNDAQPSKTRIKARVDDTITYVLRVQNRGKETVRDIVVKDAIPQGLRFVSGSISKEGTIENGVVSWKIEELAPDQIVDLTFQVKVPVVTRNSAWINIGVLIHDDKQTPSNEVTVSIEPETPASSKNGKPTSPNTAAETNHMIWLGALMISVLVLAVLWKRKKNISH